jgi:glycerol dehydrogenase
LILEQAPELEEVVGFCRSVGLPVTLDDPNIKEVTEEKIMAVAKYASGPRQFTRNMPFAASQDDIYNAIIKADELGRARKAETWAGPESNLYLGRNELCR